jgi:hypothetical protein
MGSFGITDSMVRVLRERVCGEKEGVVGYCMYHRIMASGGGLGEVPRRLVCQYALLGSAMFFTINPGRNICISSHKHHVSQPNEVFCILERPQFSQPQNQKGR